MSAPTKTEEKRLSRFFKDLEEFDDESSEDEDASSKDGQASSTENIEETASRNKVPPIRRSESGNQQNDSLAQKPKLPSAHECLKSQSNPEFLKILNKKDIDWERLHKTLPSEDSDAVTRTDYESNAVPPPTSYEPVTDPGIKVVDSEGRKRKTVNDDLEDQMSSTKAYKVHPPGEDE